MANIGSKLCFILDILITITKKLIKMVRSCFVNAVDQFNCVVTDLRIIKNMFILNFILKLLDIVFTCILMTQSSAVSLIQGER